MSIPRRLGDYEIVEEIGRGGFGVVYKARQVSLDRPVALKVLYRHLIHTQEQISRFEREARAAARLDHTALVPVYAWGPSDEDFFIVQRLIGRGRTLADELKDLREGGPPPKGHFRRVAEICAKVAEGLQHAHERGIVHRDVKPSNILLDEHGQPCLGDFGLAKVEDGLELSRTGDFAGSPFYMSPEQADSRRGPIDHQTDIYSLGVTLYEMLTLTQPFKGTTSHEIVRRILVEEPVRPARIESRAPEDLETICLKAIEKSAARRYATAAEMALDLHAYLDGEPIAAVPVSTTRRVMRAARRHREPIALAALGVLVIAGGWWTTMKLSESQDDKQLAEAGRTVEQSKTAEVSRIQQEMTSKLQEAAARNDGQAVTTLLEQQEAVRAFIDDNYSWVQNQISGMRDSGDVQAVATSFATGGLAGGLQGLQSVLAGRKSSDEGSAMLAELERRMKLLKDRDSLGEEAAAAEPAAQEAVAAAPAHLPSPWATLPHAIALDGRLYLWLGGAGFTPIVPPSGAGLTPAPTEPAPVETGDVNAPSTDSRAPSGGTSMLRGPDGEEDGAGLLGWLWGLRP